MTLTWILAFVTLGADFLIAATLYALYGENRRRRLSRRRSARARQARQHLVVRDTARLASVHRARTLRSA